MCCKRFGREESRGIAADDHLKRDTIQRRGFSLVELMVVIVIIGLLAGAVTLSVRSYLISGKQTIARMEIAKLIEGIDTFYAAYDRYPSNEEGIEILIKPTEKFPAGIISKVPTDPWGHAYEYVCPGKSAAFEIITLGADHRDGGTGADSDLKSSDQNRPKGT